MVYLNLIHLGLILLISSQSEIDSVHLLYLLESFF
jgi:hypothetical protein